MDGPLPKKNRLKGTKIDFRKLVVPKDVEDVFMSTREVPPLMPTLCSKKDVDLLELFANL